MMNTKRKTQYAVRGKQYAIRSTQSAKRKAYCKPRKAQSILQTAKLKATAQSLFLTTFDANYRLVSQ